MIVMVAAWSKRIPLNFTGWKEFSFTPEQFDRREGEWGLLKVPTISFKVPQGTVYVSDFRFLAGHPLSNQRQGVRSG